MMDIRATEGYSVPRQRLKGVRARMSDNPWVRPRRTPDSPRIPNPKHTVWPDVSDMGRDVAHSHVLAALPATGSAISPLRGLRIQDRTDPATLWCVGAHGGAGESSIAALDPSWRAAGHTWPRTEAQPARCVLLARTNLSGLLAAQAALTQWASPTTRPPVQLLGILLLADAPGKPPRPLRDLAALVAGGAPTSWQVPWIEAWRTDPVQSVAVPTPLKRLVGELRHLACPPPSPASDAIDLPHHEPVRHAVKEG